MTVRRIASRPVRLIDALRNSLGVSQLASPDITYPLLARLFRTPTERILSYKSGSIETIPPLSLSDLRKQVLGTFWKELEQRAGLDAHYLSPYLSVGEAALARSLSTYCEWLADEAERLQEVYTSTVTRSRKAFGENYAYPEALVLDELARLQSSFEMFLGFVEICGAIQTSELNRLANECFATLLQLATTKDNTLTVTHKE